jgi:hypothetical protein
VNGLFSASECSPCFLITIRFLSTASPCAMVFPSSEYYQLIRLPLLHHVFPCFVRLEKQLLFISTTKGLPRSRAIQSGYMPSVETPEGLTANHQNSAVCAAFLGVTTQSAPSFETVYRSYISVHFRYGLSHFCVRFTLIVRG